MNPSIGLYSAVFILFLILLENEHLKKIESYAKQIFFGERKTVER